MADFWAEGDLFEPAVVDVVDDTFIDLPSFAPDLRQAVLAYAPPVPRRTTIRRFKAHLVADALDLTRDRHLRRALDALELHFTEHLDGATLRAVADVAARCRSGETFLAGLELKRIWADSPLFWGSRAFGGAVPASGERGRAAMSVRRAVDIAESRGDWTAAEMIDGDWLDEWLRRPVVWPILGERVPPGFCDRPDFVLRLSPTLRGRFPEFGARTVVPVTTDRRHAGRSQAVLLDFANSFFRHLIERAVSPEFSSGYAALAGPDLDATAVVAFLVRWQTDQGEVTNEELTVATRDGSGAWRPSPAILHRLFGEPLKAGTPPGASGPERKALLQAATDRIELEAAGTSDRFKHVNDIVLLAAADCIGPEPA